MVRLQRRPNRGRVLPPRADWGIARPPPPAIVAPAPPAQFYDFILPRLAQGSHPPPGSALPFDTLILMAKEEQTVPGVTVPEVVHAGINDAVPTDQEVRTALDASGLAATRLRAGRRVLITCHMGCNRSGLASALTLLRLGYPAREAIAMVRRARKCGLGNTHFVKVIESMRMR